MSKLSAELKDQVDDLQAEGLGGRKIAKALGLTYTQVRYYLENRARSAWSKESPPTEVRPIVSYTWDLETTGLNTFFGILTVASFLDMATGLVDTRHLFSFGGSTVEREQQLLEWASGKYEDADILIGHNISAFDHNFMTGRMAQHESLPDYLPPRTHIDTLQVARHGFKGRTQGSSLENLLDFFQIAVQKDKPSKHIWAGTVRVEEEAIRRIAERCEADVRGNALLWTALRPYYHRWKGRK